MLPECGVWLIWGEIVREEVGGTVSGLHVVFQGLQASKPGDFQELPAGFSRSLVHSGSRVGDHCRTSAVGRRGTASGRPRWAPAFPGIRCASTWPRPKGRALPAMGRRTQPPHRPLTRGSRRWPRKTSGAFGTAGASPYGVSSIWRQGGKLLEMERVWKVGYGGSAPTP